MPRKKATKSATAKPANTANLPAAELEPIELDELQASLFEAIITVEREIQNEMDALMRQPRIQAKIQNVERWSKRVFASVEEKHPDINLGNYKFDAVSKQLVQK
jgi:hypothetical protein